MSFEHVGRHYRNNRPVRDYNRRHDTAGFVIAPPWVRQIVEGDYAIITASKSNLSGEENHARNEALDRELHALGYWSRLVEGVYKGGSEWSFMVPHLPRDVALSFGRKFEQESVIVDHRLLATNGDTLLTFNPRQTLYGGHAMAQENYTVMHERGHSYFFSLQP